MGSRQRHWKKVVVKLGLIEQIPGTVPALFRAGPNIENRGLYVQHRKGLAEQRLMVDDDGNVVRGPRAKDNPSDADISASMSAAETGAETAMETDKPATASMVPEPPQQRMPATARPLPANTFAAPPTTGATIEGNREARRN